VKKLVSMLALLLLLFSSFSFIRTTLSAAPTPRYGGTFVLASPYEPIDFNPGLRSNLNFEMYPPFESLLRSTSSLELKPYLATSYSVSADGLTYTFKLVQNATWHDGVKFTSADVKFTFLSVLIPYHPLGQSFFGVITAIDTPDDYTAVFHLSQPWAALPLLISNTWSAPILPQHLLQGTNPRNNTQFNFHPVGTGAFMFKEYVKGDHSTFVKYPNYWQKGKPYIDQIVVKIMPDAESEVSAMEAGEVDYIGYQLPIADVKTLQATQGINATFKGSNGLQATTLLYFNLDHPKLKNPLVRQAFAYAINRTQISQVARLGGTSPPAVGPVSYKSAWAYDPNLQPAYPTNIDKANQLLDQAGYPKQSNGTRFTITLNLVLPAFYSGDEQIVVDNMAKVGVHVVTTVLDLATANDRMFVSRTFELGMRAIFAGPDPSITMCVTFCANQIGAGSYTNGMGYNNSKADALLKQAQSEQDQTKRRAEMLQWQSTIMTDLPVYPITDENNPLAYRTIWHNMPSNPWAVGIMNMQDVWSDQGTLPSTTTTTTAVATTTTSASATAGIDPTILAVAAIVIIVIVAGAALALRRRK